MLLADVVLSNVFKSTNVYIFRSRQWLPFRNILELVANNFSIFSRLTEIYYYLDSKNFVTNRIGKHDICLRTELGFGVQGNTEVYDKWQNLDRFYEQVTFELICMNGANE